LHQQIQFLRQYAKLIPDENVRSTDHHSLIGSNAARDAMDTRSTTANRMMSWFAFMVLLAA